MTSRQTGMRLIRILLDPRVRTEHPEANDGRGCPCPRSRRKLPSAGRMPEANVRRWGVGSPALRTARGSSASRIALAARLFCTCALLMISAGQPAAIARGEDPAPVSAAPAAAGASGGPAPLAPAAPAATDTDRAKRVRAFVGAHQPELAELLDRLEKRKPGEYAAAVADLDKSVGALAASRAKDERLYELELRAWQARTRIDLLVARWMAGSKKIRARLEPEIRGAIAAEIDARAEHLAYRKQRSAAWYDRQIARLHDKREELVAERLAALLVEPARKQKPNAGDGR